MVTKPSANFSVSWTALVGVPVQFKDVSLPNSSSVPIISWHYYFGDGGESTDQNPIHTYSIPGARTIRLVIVDQAGAMDELILPDEITIYESLRNDVSLCDTSWRHPVIADQGYDFARNQGRFPMPSAHTDTIKVFDSNKYEHALVLDCTDGVWYDISTRQGADGSGLFKTWQDREGISHAVTNLAFSGPICNVSAAGFTPTLGQIVGFRGVEGSVEVNNLFATVSYVAGPGAFNVTFANDIGASPYTSGGLVFLAGTEVQPIITFREDTGEQDYYQLRHVESHFGFRPEDEKLRNTPGYDAAGFPLGLNVAMKVFTDGEPAEPASIAQSIPLTGDIFTDQDVQAKRIQTKLLLNRAQAVLIYRNQMYQELDIENDPDTNHEIENDYQQALATVDHWWTRGSDLSLDLITNIPFSTSYVAIEGPDSSTTSAFTLSGATILTAAAGLTFLGWAKAGQFVNGIDVSTYTAIRMAGAWGLYMIPAATGWVLSAGDWFDIRLYLSITSAAAQYLGNDTVQYLGRNTLPYWDV